MINRKINKRTLKLAKFYFNIKHQIIESGFANEIDWQENINFDDIDESSFLKEFAWVVLSSGMRERLIRFKFFKISDILFNWSSINLIKENKEKCYQQILKIFNNKKKINAIFYMVDYLSNYEFIVIKNRIKEEGINALINFPFMGPATSLHFLKNIGFQLAKPDRHLLRISEKTGFNNPFDMCQEIANITNEKIEVIDIVFWRYATLNRDYIKKLENSIY